MADFTDPSNDHANISLGKYQRCAKIITTDQILPEWGMKWYRGDYQSISAKYIQNPITKIVSIHLQYAIYIILYYHTWVSCLNLLREGIDHETVT